MNPVSSSTCLTMNPISSMWAAINTAGPDPSLWAIRLPKGSTLNSSTIPLSSSSMIPLILTA